LIVTVGRIRQLAALGYFVKHSARVLSEEVVPKSADDEAVVFEKFFIDGLQMLLQPVLDDILVKFQVQLHQLSPNAFAQLSKYFWAVMSFVDEPSSDSFVKRYEGGG
jgi:dimeric dUTPase (all-alpha-NTP-PPase superfamily)